jgi:DNA topoisomerase-1
MANMSYNLLIVESPTKAKTIGKYLGDGFKVVATVGHLRDLPRSKMGVDPEANFEPTYVVDKEKSSLVAELVKEAKKAKEIYFATDPDREGEAISWHMATILVEKLDGTAVNKVKRVSFHEITKEAVMEALKSPRLIDMDLVDAQQARRVLDRLVGYELSPVLWKKVRRGLSAGRVQSVAVRLICEREAEIKAFESNKFFRVEVGLDKNGQKFRTQLHSVEGKPIENSTKLKLFDGEYSHGSTNLVDKREVEKLTNTLEDKFTVAKVEKKEVQKSPLPPFTTSKLQQTAASRFGWSGKQTMSVAQKLYEKGWISYHRTDSTALSSQIVDTIRAYIADKYGKKYVPAKARHYATKSKNAQEAHEAIRPTKMDRVVENLKDAKERKLYELIWKRAVSCQAENAIIARTSIDLMSGKLDFRASGSMVVFDGYMKINGSHMEEQELPTMIAGEQVKRDEVVINEHMTSPPPRYGDASLVSSLEKQGIGRPSTYAPIISTIQARLYVEKQEGRFHPTALGEAVNTFLVKNFETIVSLPFTADMEEGLDKVAEGKAKWRDMMAEFWRSFKPGVDKVTVEGDRVKIEVEKTGIKCDKCGEGELVVRSGRFGKFLACSRFPECKNTQQIKNIADFKCPTCGKDVLIKKTKKGRKFFGCSDYPTCKWAGWKKP